MQCRRNFNRGADSRFQAFGTTKKKPRFRKHSDWCEKKKNRTTCVEYALQEEIAAKPDIFAKPVVYHCT